MDQSEERRQRLGQMLDLAQTYRGWTRKDLARALRRDPTKLIPGSGVPKLDLVVDLARALDWGLEDVVDHVWCPEHTDHDDSSAAVVSFEAADRLARAAHREGRYTDLVDAAREAFELAQSPEERARACNREAGGWDGLGRYQASLKAIQRGLAEKPVSGPYRRMLQSNLANAYYTVWSLLEAKAVARDLLDWYEDEPPTTIRDRKTMYFAHYVVGQTWRRLLSSQTDDRQMLSRRARRHLTAAADGYRALAVELGDPSLAGIAGTCEAGIIEAEVAAGERPAVGAMVELSTALDAVPDPSTSDLTGDELECLGWRCIFGCNIALRDIDDEAQVQHYMAIFSNKAEEIAEALDDWAIRERVFTLEHTRWERSTRAGEFESPALVDKQDIRTITGTMARFPSFRDTGWEILRSAKLISGS